MSGSTGSINTRRITVLEYVIDTLPVAGRHRECVVDCTPLLAATPDEAVEMAELRRETPWSDARRAALAERVAVAWPGLQRWWVDRRCHQLARALESGAPAFDFGPLLNSEAVRPLYDPPGVVLGDGRIFRALHIARHEVRDRQARGDTQMAEQAINRIARLIDAIEWCRRSLYGFDSLHEWEDRAVDQVEACDRRLGAEAHSSMPARDYRGASEKRVCRTLAPGR